MKVTKKISNYEIVDSGSLITCDNSQRVEFTVECDNGFVFILRFEFEKNSDNGHNLKLRIDNNNTIVFLCTNFDNTLGTGTNKPIELATVDNKKIYINFWIYALGQDTLKKIDYTIYKEN